MRSFIAALSAILSLLLLGAAVPAIWADRNVVSEDGFVALAGPLGSDKSFQSSLVSATTKQVTSQLKMDAGLAAFVAPIVNAAASGLSQDPGYSGAWTETLRRSHRLTVSDSADSTAALTLDVAPMLGLVAKKVASGIGAEVSTPSQVLISLGQPSQRTAIVKLATYAPLGYWAAAAGVLLLFLALLSAHRRSTTLLLYGVGGLVVCAFWMVLISVVGGAVSNSASGNSVADLFKTQFVHAASDSFTTWIVVGAVASAVLAVLGGVSRIFARR